MQPIADIEQSYGGKNRDEAFHAFAMLSAESQNRLSGDPGEAAGDQREDPAQMDVANGVAWRP